MTYRAVLREIEATLAKNPDLLARGLIEVEAMIILQFASENIEKKRTSATEMKLHLEQSCLPDVHKVALAVATKRAEGEILQYVTGTQTFLDHEYRVTPDVLVPRPETEILVRTALERLREPSIGLELGLGSGAISIELLSQFPRLEMITTEVSQGAIQVARENARTILGERNSQLRILPFVKLTDICEPFKRFLKGRTADFLISNPPYLTLSDEIAEDVKQYEPELALFAPLDHPLYFYEGIATQAREILSSGGQVFLEVPHERAEAIRSLFDGLKWSIDLIPDLTGRSRVLVASVSQA